MARTVQKRTVSGYGAATSKLVSLSPDGKFLLGMCHFSATLSDSYHGIWNGSAYVPVSPDDRQLNERAVAWYPDSSHYIMIRSNGTNAINIQLRSVDQVTGSSTLIATVTPPVTEDLIGVVRIVGDLFIAWTSQRIYVLRADTSAGTLTLLQNIPTNATFGTMREVLGTGLDGYFIVEAGTTAAQVRISTATLNTSTGAITFHTAQSGGGYTIATDIFMLAFKQGTRRFFAGGITFANSRMFDLDVSGAYPVLVVQPAGGVDLTHIPNNDTANEMAGTNGQTGAWVFNQNVLLFVRNSVGNLPRLGRERYFNAEGANAYQTATDILPMNLLGISPGWASAGVNMKRGISSDGNLYAVAIDNNAEGIAVLQMLDDSPQPSSFVAQARKHTAVVDIEALQPLDAEFVAQARPHSAAIVVEEVVTRPVYLVAQTRKHNAVLLASVQFDAEFVAQTKKHTAELNVDAGMYIDLGGVTRKHNAHLDAPARRRRIVISVNRR